MHNLKFRQENKKKNLTKFSLGLSILFLIVILLSSCSFALSNISQNKSINNTNNKINQNPKTLPNPIKTIITGEKEDSINRLLREADYTFFINSNKVDVEIDYFLYQRKRLKLSLDLPDDSYNVRSFTDNISSNISYINRDTRKISVNKMLSEFKLNYVTRSLLKKGLFIIRVRVPYNVSHLIIKVKLSPEYVLNTPIKHEDFGSASIYPKPDHIESDGQSLIFVWEYNNTKNDASFPVVLLVKKRINTTYIIISFIILLVAVAFFIKKKPSVKKVIVRKIDKISPHLKEDEEQIIKILKQREGHCEQGTLRIITDMSKANLSRILKELEERKLIRKVKKKKKNIIYKI